MGIIRDVSSYFCLHLCDFLKKGCQESIVLCKDLEIFLCGRVLFSARLHKFTHVGWTSERKRLPIKQH